MDAPPRRAGRRRRRGGWGAARVRRGRRCRCWPATPRTRSARPAAASCSCPGPTGSATGGTPSRARDQQLPLTEPALHNASHGLLRWATWSVRGAGRRPRRRRRRPPPPAGLVRHPRRRGHLRARPTTGSPSRRGSPTSVTARRRSGTAPTPTSRSATAPRPRPCSRLPAGTSCCTDDRSLPTGVEPVPAGARLPPRRAASARTELDTPYGDVVRGDDGRWVASLEAGGDRRGSLWADESFPWLQAFTGRARDGKGSPRAASPSSR